MRRAPHRSPALLALGLVATLAAAATAEHPSIGVCTRKDEFAKRQEVPEQPVAREIGWFQAYGAV